MESAEQARLTEQFMLRIAPTVTRFALNAMMRPQISISWDEETSAEQRRATAQYAARVSLEIAMHLSAAAVSVTHAAKDATATKNPASAQVEALRYQQERGLGGTT